MRGPGTRRLFSYLHRDKFRRLRSILFLKFVCNYATWEERVIHATVLLNCCFAAVYFQQARPTHLTTTIITKGE